MKNWKVFFYLLFLFTLTQQVGKGDMSMIVCNDRIGLEKLTGIPSIGIAIDNIDQLTSDSTGATTIVVQLEVTDDDALRCFYDRGDGSGINDTNLSQFSTPWYNALFNSYGISRNMILTHVGVFLELTVDDVILK